MNLRTKTTATLLTAAAVLLSGCEAGVATRVDVESATESKIVATIRFTDEAAEQLVENEKLDAQLQDLIQNRVGREPERSGDEEELTYQVGLTYEEMLSAQDVLGIQGAAIEGETEDDVTLTLQLAPPVGLNEAIVQATATQPDAQALAETMLKTTTVAVVVGFEGGVTGVEGPYEVKREESSVSVTQSLATFQTGTLVVSGDPQKSFLATYGLGLGIGGGLLALLILVLHSRRKALAEGS